MASRTQEVIKFLVENGHSPEIEPEAIDRFIDGTMKDEYVHHVDALQTAALLVGLINGVKAGDDMGVQLRQILKIRKDKKSRFNPSTVHPESVIWAIMERRERGEITTGDAIEEIKKQIPASKRQIQNWIKVMAPRVKDSVDTADSVKAFFKMLKENPIEGDYSDS